MSDTTNFVSAKEVWGLEDVDMIKANLASKRFKMKHGMFSSIPLLCRGKSCPYDKVCSIPQDQRVIKGRCPVEIGAIIARFDSWCKHFGIDTDSEMINDEDLVDATLIRDLVDNEIQTLRAENKLAINGDFIGQTIASVDNKGVEHYEDTVTPEAEFKMTLQEKRYKILQLLNSTRKDKARELNKELNPSSKAMSIFNMIGEKMIGVDLDNIEDDDNANAKDQHGGSEQTSVKDEV
jgi:hypothetical protein